MSRHCISYTTRGILGGVHIFQDILGNIPIFPGCGPEFQRSPFSKDACYKLVISCFFQCYCSNTTSVVNSCHLRTEVLRWYEWPPHPMHKWLTYADVPFFWNLSVTIFLVRDSRTCVLAPPNDEVVCVCRWFVHEVMQCVNTQLITPI